MSHDLPPPSATVDAGPFGAWLSQFRASLNGSGGTDVPCGDCVGCCVSSYSILVRAEDTQALATIPSQYLRSVPTLGEGVKAMGFLHDGTCPMLEQGKCSIYAARPQTCRDYDCRVFAAAGIDAGEGKTVINARVREWHFTYETEADRENHRAVQATAAFIAAQAERLPQFRLPKNPSGVAVMAVKSFELFLQERSDRTDAEIAAAIVAASRE